MRCRIVRNLLSAYVDGELEISVRESIEKHIEVCHSCKDTLKDHIAKHQMVLAIATVPELPDIGSSVLSAIWGTKRKTNEWLRPVLVLVSIVVVMATITALISLNIAMNPGRVLANAYDAVEGIESYRIYGSTTERNQTMATWSTTTVMEYEFASRDTYHIKIGTPEGNSPDSSLELFVIDDSIYYRISSYLADQLPDSTMQNVIEKIRQGTFFDDALPNKENILIILSSLTSVKRIATTTIDGVQCQHYKGKTNTDILIPKLLKQHEEYYGYGKTSIAYQNLVKGLHDYWTSRQQIVDLWISEDDYLLRQISVTVEPISESGLTTAKLHSSTAKYSDFNETMDIKAPLDEQGNLLPGWLIYQK